MRLHLQLLGHFCLTDMNLQEIQIKSRKAKALFGYIAAKKTQLTSRAELAQILWERHDQQQALTSLRQALSVLNKQLGSDNSDWLIKDNGFLSFNPEIIQTDINAFQLNSFPDTLDKTTHLVDLYRGEFLEGLVFREHTLSEWLIEQRRQTEIRLIELLKHQLSLQIQAGKIESAMSTAERLVSIDPIDEDSHRQLMHLFSAQGQRHRILRQYQHCCQALEACEISSPHPDTVSLFQTLYNETQVQSVFTVESSDIQIGASNGPSASDTLDKVPAIAVLPFKNSTTPSDPISLGVALAEEITHELRRYQGFKVISALSAKSINQTLDLKSTASQLGARYLVSGSLQQYNNQILASVELVDAENGELIWAERYSRSTDDLFILQTELASDIAGAIEPEAIGHAYLLSCRKAPSSMSAWDLVLRGDHQLFLQVGTRWNSDFAQRLYKKAMSLSPDYAPAYTGLAYSLCLELKEDIATDKTRIRIQMREMAEHGARLDPNNPWCMVVLGRVLQQSQEYDAAITVYQKAVELCPSSAKAHFGLGFGLSSSGQYDDAIVAMNRAIELSPRDPMSWSFHVVKALTHLYSEDFELAAEASRASIAHPSANHWATVIQAPSLIHLGQYDDALKVLDAARKSKPNLSIKSVENAFKIRNEQDSLSIIDGLYEAGLPKQ